jgi:hypothetical protein
MGHDAARFAGRTLAMNAIAAELALRLLVAQVRVQQSIGQTFCASITTYGMQ